MVLIICYYHSFLLDCSISEEWKSAQWTVDANKFDTDTIRDDLSFLLESVEVSLQVWGETELS